MDGREDAPEAATLRVDSTHQGIRVARHWVGERLRELGCDPDFTGEALLAVGEALTNVVRHAYREEAGHPIDLKVSATAQAVEFVIEDEAPYFEDDRIGHLPDPLVLAEGGYGIFLMQTIMDEVRREARGRTGNTLRMIKYRPDVERKVS